VPTADADLARQECTHPCCVLCCRLVAITLLSSRHCTPCVDQLAAVAAALFCRCPAAAPQQEERSSLIPETLQNLAADTELQATLAAVAAKGQQQLTHEEAKARKRSLQGLGLPSFQQKLQVRLLLLLLTPRWVEATWLLPLLVPDLHDACVP
jgi:hypothetical protein